MRRINSYLKHICFLVILLSNYRCDSTSVGPEESESIERHVSVGKLIINNGGDIFATISGAGMFRSADNGDTWSKIDMGFPSATIGETAINGNGDIFVSVGGIGMVRSVDNGLTWKKINTGLRDTVFTAITFGKDDDIFVAHSWHRGSITSLTGVYRSTDNGDLWTRTGFPTGRWIIQLASNNNGDIFAGTPSGMLRSRDNGASWRNINLGLAPGSCATLACNVVSCRLACWAIAISDSGHIIRGSQCDGVYRSRDLGATWIKSAGDGTFSESFINTIAVGSNGNMFAGTWTGGIWHSTDHGTSWRLNFATDFRVNDIAIGNNGNIFASTDGGLYRSTDHGSTWMLLESLDEAND